MSRRKKVIKWRKWWRWSFKVPDDSPTTRGMERAYNRVAMAYNRRKGIDV